MAQLSHATLVLIVYARRISSRKAQWLLGLQSAPSSFSLPPIAAAAMPSLFSFRMPLRGVYMVALVPHDCILTGAKRAMPKTEWRQRGGAAKPVDYQHHQDSRPKTSPVGAAIV